MTSDGRKGDALSPEEVTRHVSEPVPDRESLSTVGTGAWIGVATASEVAAEPSPVDDVYTIQPVPENGP